MAVAAVAGALSTARVPSEARAAISWVPRGAFAGMQFTSLLSPPGLPCIIIFTALQNGGLKGSTDCGVQFADLLFADVHGVTAKDENIGYTAAGGLGVLKTIDQGVAWFPVNDGLPALADARSVVIHLGFPDSVFCGLDGGGVFVGGPSVDSLIQWTSLNAGLGDLRIRHLARVRGGTYLMAAADGGIWRREGGVWSAVAPGLVANRIVIDAADSSRVYAATEGGVYRSTDAGQSFFASSSGLPAAVAINDIARRTDVNHVLYVGTRGAGVYESTDFGATWHAFGPALPGDNDVRAVLGAVETNKNLARVFAGTKQDGLFEAQISTQTVTTTWGRLTGGVPRLKFASPVHGK